MLFIPSTSTNYEVATSYLDVIEADTILQSQLDSDDWMSCTLEAKQILLTQSSLAVDGVYSYKGGKTSNNQVLKFPRGGKDTIPTNVKYAVAMMCMEYAKDEAFRNVTSERIGKMAWTFGGKGEAVSDSVLTFLKPLKARSIKVRTP